MKLWRDAKSWKAILHERDDVDERGCGYICVCPGHSGELVPFQLQVAELSEKVV